VPALYSFDDLSPAVIWFTGLSGSGKTTTAIALKEALEAAGISSFILDGDRLREGLNSDLGFSAADRDENVRRTGEVAALFAEAGIVAIVSLISPYRRGREQARRAAGEGRFFEIYMATPLEECIRRDAKGLYARAQSGDLAEFTGISAPYEAPENPDLSFDATSLSTAAIVDAIVRHLREGGLS